MTQSMKYDHVNMMAVITDVGKQLNEFTSTLDTFRDELKKLSVQWEGGASGAANALGVKLERQGNEISGTVGRFIAAMEKNLEDSRNTELANQRLFDPSA